jgi:hypothetical protein
VTGVIRVGLGGWREIPLMLMLAHMSALYIG